MYLMLLLWGLCIESVSAQKQIILELSELSEKKTLDLRLNKVKYQLLLNNWFSNCLIDSLFIGFSRFSP